MNLTCLTRYDDLGASSRLRIGQYRLPLAHLAPEVHWSRQSLLDAPYLRSKYAGRSTVRSAMRCYARRARELASQHAPELWWVEKELWPYAPAWLERSLLARHPYVLDLDDAVFHSYDTHRQGWIRWGWGRKIDRLMEGAALVTAGNAYLAERAVRAGARWVEIVPTVIDLDSYPPPASHGPSAGDAVDIVWIGSPATSAYVEMLAEPLRQLAAGNRVRLVVIGIDAPHMPGVEVVAKTWSAETEAADIASCEIGVMPLPDSPWERGKCGYKLIQYMACGLPAVASPVGVNCDIVQPGHNGLLAADGAQWLHSLQQLVVDAELRRRFGRAGRALVERLYSVQVQAPRLAAMLQQAATAR